MSDNIHIKLPDGSEKEVPKGTTALEIAGCPISRALCEKWAIPNFSTLKLSTIDSNTCGTSGTCLTYDALGRVVEKNVGGVFTQILYSPVGKIALLSGQTTQRSYMPLPGGATESEIGAMAGTHNVWHKDWLGSVRFASRVVDRTALFDHAFAPFGEVYDEATDPSAALDFTGDTQDLVAGTFDTPNRELNPNQGRWLSPDPAGLAAADFTNPQTWNRYAYVRNNPLNEIDPLGLGPYGWSPCRYQTNGAAGIGGDEFDYLFPATVGSEGDWGHNFFPVAGGPCQFGICGFEGGGGGGAGGNNERACLAGAGPLAAGQSRCAANNGNQPKSSARQQCEQNAQTEYQSAIDDAKFTAVRDGVIGMVVATALSGAVGCSEAVEFAGTPSLVVGPEGPPTTCGAGFAFQALWDLPTNFYAVTGTSAAIYAVNAQNANNALNQELNACSLIP